MSIRRLAAPPILAAGIALAVSPAHADEPVPVDDYLVTAEDHAFEFDEADLLANDFDGGMTVEVAVEAGPGHGLLERSGPTFVYLPDAGFVGADSFTYRLIAGHLASKLATVRLQVSPLVLPIAGEWIGADGQPVPRATEHAADVGWFNSVFGYFALVRVDRLL